MIAGRYRAKAVTRGMKIRSKSLPIDGVLEDDGIMIFCTVINEKTKTLLCLLFVN